MNANSSGKEHRPPQRSAYNPVTLTDLQKPALSASKIALNRLVTPVSRCVAAPLFAAILFYREKLPALVPLPILLLIVCLFWRLDGQARRIAAVPLSLSGIKLFFSITDYLRQTHENAGLQPAVFQPGFSWLPLFFSICLVLIAQKESATFKVILTGSCALLASGLLPGQGFVSIFLVAEVMLFFAVTIAVFADLLPYFTTPARPLASTTPAISPSPLAH